MEQITLDRAGLKKFGMVMGVVFFIVSSIYLLRNRINLSILMYIFSFLFFLIAFIVPTLLKPIYIFWMRLAFIVSWFNTHLFLIIIFYLIFTPIGMIMRVFGIDLLDRKIDKNQSSYWKKKSKEDFNSLDYERQF